MYQGNRYCQVEKTTAFTLFDQTNRMKHKVLSLTFIYLTSSISGKYPPSSTSTGKKTSYKLLVTLNSLESLRECNILTDMTGIQLKAPVLVETDVRRLLQLCRDSINPNWM